MDVRLGHLDGRAEWARDVQVCTRVYEYLCRFRVATGSGVVHGCPAIVRKLVDISTRFNQHPNNLEVVASKANSNGVVQSCHATFVHPLVCLLFRLQEGPDCGQDAVSCRPVYRMPKRGFEYGDCAVVYRWNGLLKLRTQRPNVVLTPHRVPAQLVYLSKSESILDRELWEYLRGKYPGQLRGEGIQR